MALTRIPSSGLEGNITLGNVVISGSITNSLGQPYTTGGGGGAGGYTGSAGSLGYTGSAGTLGTTGFTGSGGVAGSVGFTGSQGNTGLGFAIAKSYATVAALTADTAPTGIVAGQFAIIETGSVNDADNSKLYLWSGTAYSYVTDLSGAAGITGPAGGTGFTGSVGIVGFTGSASTVAGFTGSIGYTGSTSEATSVTVSPVFKGALVGTNTTQSITASTWTNLTILNTTVYDTTNFLSTANRFTIPSGVDKVKVSGSWGGVSQTDQFILRITKNGVVSYTSQTDIDSIGADASFATTPVVPVVAGDYFELQVYSENTRSTVASAGYNWFAIEVVEGSILDTTSVIRTTGFTGSSGSDGTVGFTGSGGAGFTGSAGANGATGVIGPQGPIGYTGSAGGGGGGGGSVGYTGSAGVAAIQEFVATAGQDTFAVSGGYAIGSVLVFVNGIQMNNNDYAAGDAVSVVTTEPRNQGDVVRVIFNMVSPSININDIKTFSVAMSIALGL
jgi:hypothetical protein